MQEEKENVPNLANDHLFWQNTKGTIHLGRPQFGGGGGGEICLQKVVKELPTGRGRGGVVKKCAKFVNVLNGWSQSL